MSISEIEVLRENVKPMPKPVKEINEFDRQLLRLLQRNSNTTTTLLAEQLKSSRRRVVSRILSLEEEKIIRFYPTIIDWSKIGYKVSSKICLALKPKDVVPLLDQLNTHSSVASIAELRGRYNVQILLLSRTMKDLDRFLDKQIATNSNISESVQIGIEKQKPQLQNIPMTLLPPEWMEAILQRKLLKVCLEKTPDSSHTDTLKNLGLHAVMIQPMHDPVTQKPVGFVGIGVMHHRDDFMDAKNIFALKRAADIIEELLIKWKNQ